MAQETSTLEATLSAIMGTMASIQNQLAISEDRQQEFEKKLLVVQSAILPLKEGDVTHLKSDDKAYENRNPSNLGNTGNTARRDSGIGFQIDQQSKMPTLQPTPT